MTETKENLLIFLEEKIEGEIEISKMGKLNYRQTTVTVFLTSGEIP